MELFQRHYAATDKTVEVQILDPAGIGWDECREVRLLFDDGQRLTATFWRDPKGRDSHWWEEMGMAIVEDLTTARILVMVDELLQRGMVEEWLRPIPT